MDFATFKALVKAVVFPIGEPENLTAIHDTYIVDGLAEIQKYVKCYRANNVDVIAFSDTRYNGGLTIAESPDGFIKRVYTVGSDFNCKVNYRKSTRAYLAHKEATHEIDFGEKTRPSQAGKPALQLGDMFPDRSADSTLGRAVTGYWALEGCRLYLWPHLQSTEDLVIEWTGTKDTYSDSDRVYDSAPRLQRAVRLYLQREIARDLDCDDNKLAKYTAEFSDAIGDLIWHCKQKLEGTYAEEDELPILTNGCASPGLNTITGTSDDTTSTVDNPWLYRFAVVGSYGDQSLEASNVAKLVNGWKPDFVVTTGNTFADSAEFAVIDSAIGSLYHSYINPYFGAYGAGATDRNRFWPCGDDGTFSSSTSLAAYLNYFSSIPRANAGRYYDHVEGPVHFFFLDGDAGCPDGRTTESVQAEWLKVKLAASPCKFKVVIVYEAPYTSFSSSAGQTPDLRWPFKAWGATVVLTGIAAAYERSYADGIPFLNNGAGGSNREPAHGPSEFSVKTYVTQPGAQIVTVNCDSIKFDFYAVDNTLIDTLEIK